VSHQIALNFEDGVTRFVDCLPNETVADAAYRQGLFIPLDCRDGACGTCKSFCESGNFEIKDYLEDALSSQEAEQGFILTCKAKPKADGVIRIPMTSNACRIADGGLRKARISRLEMLTESTIWLELEGPEISKLKFLPGQYAHLQIPGARETRAYSFSSVVKADRVGFLIRNVPGGKMSVALSEMAREGDDLLWRAPYGSFYLREIQRPLLMIAGGTGLAPFLAMLEHIAATSVEMPIHLLYGVTHDQDLVCLDVLNEMKLRLPMFEYTVTVAKTTAGGQHQGVVTDFLMPEHLHEGQVDVYLCGPPPMVAAVEKHIRELGLTPTSMHFEKFLPAQ